MKRHIPVAVAFILAGALTSLRAAGPTHAEAFSDDGLLKADFNNLKTTSVTVNPNVPLVPGRNVLWCGTFQLAWNEAIGLVGEKLNFVDQPPLVILLNQQDFTKQELDASSYVAIADFEKNHVEAEIRAALEKTFGGKASPELIPPVPKHFGPDDFVAYAYLFKNLAFENPFENRPSLQFDGTAVKNFGTDKAKNEELRKMQEQVSICYYDSDDDFIIKLATKNPEDELILAKVPKPATLQAGIRDVVAKLAQSQPLRMGQKDTLAVPKLNFDLRGDIPGLVGLVLKPGPNAKVKGLKISEAKQLIRFQFNEKGAVLKSEAVIAMVGSAMPLNPPTIHHLVFDQPFLVLMKQAKSDKPYFALWVGNASLLVPAK